MKGSMLIGAIVIVVLVVIIFVTMAPSTQQQLQNNTASSLNKTMTTNYSDVLSSAVSKIQLNFNDFFSGTEYNETTIPYVMKSNRTLGQVEKKNCTLIEDPFLHYECS